VAQLIDARLMYSHSCTATDLPMTRCHSLLTSHNKQMQVSNGIGKAGVYKTAPVTLVVIDSVDHYEGYWSIRQ